VQYTRAAITLEEGQRFIFIVFIFTVFILIV